MAGLDDASPFGERRPGRRRGLVAVAVVAAAALVIGFVGTQVRGSDRDSSVATAATSRWSGVLDAVPADVSGLTLYDFERIAAQRDIDVHSEKASGAEAEQIRREVWNDPTFGPTPGQLAFAGATAEELRAALGFDHAEVQRAVAYQVEERERPAGPPRTIAILEGSFSPDDVRSAVEADPAWSPDLERVEVEDTNEAFHSWGESRTLDLSRGSAVRPHGVGHNLFVDASTVVWAASRSDLVDVLLTRAGERESLSGGASGLDEVIAALDATDSPVITASSALGLMESIDAGGWGFAVVDGSARITFAFAYPGAEEAEDGATAFEQASREPSLDGQVRLIGTETSGRVALGAVEVLQDVRPDQLISSRAVLPLIPVAAVEPS